MTVSVCIGLAILSLIRRVSSEGFQSISSPHTHRSHDCHVMGPTYLYRHDPGYDWHGDANLPAVPVEPEERAGLKEELRNDEIRPSVHLLLQVLQILLIAGAVRVPVGVA